MKKTKFLGTATITPSGNIEVASSHEFRVRYQVGKSGIKTGGILRVEVPGKLGWSRPHVVGDNEALGFTRVICSRKDVQHSTSIEPVTDVDFVGNKKIERWIVVRLDKGNLRPGDTITIIYGPHRFGYGPGVRTTHHAYSRDKNREEFTVCVDPDGKQGLQEVSKSPGINMVPTTFMHYEAFTPSIRMVGEKSHLKITAWDRFYNPCIHHEANISIKGPIQKKAHLSKKERAVLDIRNISLSKKGVHRFEILDSKHGLKIKSNPVMVYDKESYGVFWGDIHLHTSFSIDNKYRDRMLYNPTHYCTYARDTNGLDFIGLTDHHEPWHPHHALTNDEWEETVTTVNKYNQTGRFVALAGYEFRDRRGDTNVYLPGDNPTRVPESVDGIRKVWGYYRKTGEEAITMPHLHPYSNYEKPNAHLDRSPGYDVVWHPEDWDSIDTHFERATEICSVWGRYEFYKNRPHCPPSGMLKGNSVQDLLQRGHRLGIVGGSDGHKGNPGNACLVAVYAKELSRRAIFEGLRNRFCYGTTHARILLRFEANASPMGSEIKTKGELNLVAEVHGTNRIYSVEILKNNEVLYQQLGNGKMDLVLEHKEHQMENLAFYYVRVLQEDEEMAWSSPIWVEK